MGPAGWWCRRAVPPPEEEEEESGAVMIEALGASRRCGERGGVLFDVDKETPCFFLLRFLLNILL